MALTKDYDNYRYYCNDQTYEHYIHTNTHPRDFDYVKTCNIIADLRHIFKIRTFTLNLLAKRIQQLAREYIYQPNLKYFHDAKQRFDDLCDGAKLTN